MAPFDGESVADIKSAYQIKIGDLPLPSPVLLAPMAGVTDLPFRKICRQMGAGLVCTEMISAKGLCLGNPKTLSLLWTDGGDRPLSMQLFGSDPVMMAEAARICQEKGADIIDINMGCPVPKVVRQGAGAALLRDLGLMEKVIKEARKAVDIPLTVKMRSGWDKGHIVATEAARICDQQGVDAVVIHPRTRSQGYEIPANWDLIAQIREVVSIPVIGNGDVFSPQDVLRMLRRTGCSAVMIGRAARGDPWIFARSLQALEGREPDVLPSLPERLDLVRQHLHAICESYRQERALGVSKNHLMRYLRGLPGGRRLRERVSRARDIRELFVLLEHVSNPL